MAWKGSGRSLLEAPSERDIAQHSRPAGEHATATFLANFVSTSYQSYACCMSYSRCRSEITTCAAMFNIQQFYVLPTQCIYVFCVDLRTNSDYFPIQH